MRPFYFFRSIFHVIFFVCLPIQALALDTTVTLTADGTVLPTNTELITFGLPLAEGDILNNAEIKVLINNEEQAISIENGLMWHWSDDSIRSVSIQLQAVDMSQGDVILNITDAGSNVARLKQLPPENGWIAAGPDKNNLPFPRIFALHDSQYLADSGIVAPYLPAPTANNFSQYQSGQFDNWAGDLNYSKSRARNWLFDRSSAMYKAYLNATNNEDRVKYLKEAFLSKQFYYNYVRDDDTRPKPAGGDGCWTYGGVSCADGKYIQPQSAKLTLALMGDHSQWDNELIVKMALMSDIGWNQHPSRDRYNFETEGFTERGAGMAGLAELHAYEITGNRRVLSHMNARISSLKDMQQTEKEWDSKNGWLPKSGAFTHSFAVHEGNSKQANTPLGNANDRVFSPWMSENIADFLWQAHQVTNNEDIPMMLRLLGNAIEYYGFTSRYIDGQYEKRQGFNSGPKTESCNTEAEATDVLYFASAFASQDSQGIANDEWWTRYSDSHAVEIVLPLALAYYFETDAIQRHILQARIEKITAGWLNSACESDVSGVYRLWNWQHRSNSISTWHWAKNQVELLK